MGGCQNTARESCKEVDFYLRQDLPGTRIERTDFSNG